MAYTLLTRVENLVGTVPSVTALNDWLTTGAHLFIDILPQREFLQKATFYTMANNASVDGARYDWETASGVQMKLLMVPNSVFEMLSNTSSLYSLPTTALGVIAATVRDTQIKVHPGTESIRLLGILYPTVLNTQSSVTGLPDDWLHPLCLYAAIHARKKQILDLLDAGSVTVGTLPAPPLYVGPTLTLTSAPSDFTLAVIPPVAPDAPVFTYSGPTPLVLGLVQITTPSTPPTYTAPILTLDSPPADFVPTGISIPTPPDVPSILYTDAIASTIGTVTIGALPSAPSYSQPSLNLPPPPADLVYSGAVVVPTAPSTPSITSTDATAGTITSVTISALPTAPVYVSPSMEWTSPPSDFVPGTVPPSPPATPSISYTDATATTVASVTLEPLGNAPTFTWTPGAGPQISASAATPSAPSAPTFNYSNVSNQIISEIGMDELPTAPVFVPAPGVDFTGMTFPTAPTLPATPIAPAIPTLSFTDAVVSTISDSFIIDLSSSLTELTQATTGYINGVEDVELAMAKINEIGKRIDVANVDFQTNLAKARANAELTTDVNKFNELQTLQAAIATVQQQVNVYQADVQAFLSNTQALTTLYRAQVEAVTAQRNAELQRFVSEMNGTVSRFDGEVKQYLSQTQVIIQEAQLRLDQQKTSAQINGNIDLQNALQLVETEIKEYQASVQRFSAQIENYKAEYNLELSLLKLSVDEWMAEEKYAYDNAIAEFNEGLQEYQAKLQRLLAQGRIDIEKATADANLATDVAKQNEIYTFQAAVQDYVQELELYKTLVQGYQTQVNEEIATFRANLEKWQVVRTTEIQKYAQDVVAAQAAFNAEVESYRAAVAKNQRQAEIDLQRYIAQAGLDTDVSKDNKTRTLQALIQDYAQELGLYERQITSYQSVVNAELQKARANFEKWQNEAQNSIAAYAQAIQNSLGAFQASLAEYRAGMEKLIKQADIDAAKASQQAQLETDISKANKAQALAAAIQDWQGRLQLYVERLKGYTVQTQNEIAVYDMNLKKWQTIRSSNISAYQAEFQGAQTAFQAMLAKYQADLQQNIEQARVDSERILNEAKMTTDLSLQNALQAMNADIQEYASQLQLFAAKVNSYQTETNSAIAVYRANLEKWQTVAATEIQKFQADIQSAQAKLQSDIQAFQAEVQKVFKQADIDLTVLDLNLRAAMSQVGDYTRELNMFFQLKGIPFSLGATNDAAVNNRTGNQ